MPLRCIARYSNKRYRADQLTVVKFTILGLASFQFDYGCQMRRRIHADSEAMNPSLSILLKAKRTEFMEFISSLFGSIEKVFLFSLNGTFFVFFFSHNWAITTTPHACRSDSLEDMITLVRYYCECHKNWWCFSGSLSTWR